MKSIHKAAAGIAAAVVLAGVVTVASLWSLRQINEATAVRQHTTNILNRAGALMSDLKDAETGQRGYLLTGDEAFLKPWSAAQGGIAAALVELRRITLLAAAQRHLDALQPLLDAKLAHLAQDIELKRANKLTAALANQRTIEGKRLMEAIGNEMSGVIRLEQDILLQRDAEFRENMRQLLSIVVFTGLLALLVMLAFAYFLYRESQQRLKDAIHLEARHVFEFQARASAELERANLTLRDSEAQIQTILNTVVDGIITLHARGGIIETVNPAAERMFGYAAAELVGQNFSRLIPELDRDQRTASLEYYSPSDEARASGLGREVAGLRRDGSVFPLEIAVSEMILGGQRYFTGILRDITARKQAEAALQKAGALQSAIFNSANFSSIATDARGVIQIFNVGAERMLGYAAADVMNKITPADISDPQEVIARAQALSRELGTPITPGFEALVFKASRGIEDIYELTYIRQDGSRFPAVVSVTALRDEHDAIIGYLLIGTDNTARKQVEAERTRLDQALQDRNIELESARNIADKANLAKSDFLSSMSHELRTPLNAILGFAQLMESGAPPPTPAQQRNLDQILKAGWYLLELINEILDLALIESGKATLSHEPVSLAEVMLECRAMVEPQAGKRSIGMSFPRFDLPYFVSADRTRLKQVLINLLFNAIKYNRPGGSVVVDYVLSPQKGIRISVRDTGLGLDARQLGQLFQPFNRLGREDGEEEGTGIGLVVTKRLVELMGGSIGAESTVGAGSVFWFDLRLTSAPQLAIEEAGQAALERPQLAGLPQRTVLYVEDNPANLELVEQLLARRHDLRLLSAADGKQGIEIARSYLPDIILMDINLPGISGLEAMQILQADPVTSHIPIIALSANAIPRDIEKALQAGFFNYLTKPIKVNLFMDALDVALKIAHAPPQGDAKEVTA